MESVVKLACKPERPLGGLGRVEAPFGEPQRVRAEQLALVGPEVALVEEWEQDV